MRPWTALVPAGDQRGHCWTWEEVITEQPGLGQHTCPLRQTCLPFLTLPLVLGHRQGPLCNLCKGDLRMCLFPMCAAEMAKCVLSQGLPVSCLPRSHLLNSSARYCGSCGTVTWPVRHHAVPVGAPHLVALRTVYDFRAKDVIEPRARCFEPTTEGLTLSVRDITWVPV